MATDANTITNEAESNNELLNVLVRNVFDKGLGIKPHDWQVDAAVHVLNMWKQPHILPPQPTLLVRSTGGGKSAVRDAIGLSTGGITLTIVPLLSLGADQQVKMNKIIEKYHPNNNNVTCYHLDDYENYEMHLTLCKKLLDHQFNDQHSIFIFASPQSIVNKPCWKKTIPILLAKGLIRLIAIDEAHLFAQFGLSFRPEFPELEPILFAILQQFRSKVTLPPVLFMTATATKTIIDNLKLLTGLEILPENMLWPTDTAGVERHNVLLELYQREKNFPIIKKETDVIIKNIASNYKFIVYTNLLSQCENLAKTFRAYLVDKGIIMFIVIVVGTLFREMKFWHTKQFTTINKLTENCDATGEEMVYIPRGMFATAGAANAGIDCRDVIAVIRIGLPETAEDFGQEMGRCGRLARTEKRALGIQDKYVLVVSFIWYEMSRLSSSLPPLYPGQVT